MAIDLAAFYDEATAWFKDLTILPAKIGVDGPSFREEMVRHTSGIRERLMRELSHVRSVSLFSIFPETKDWIVSPESATAESKSGTILFCWDEALQSINSELIRNLVLTCEKVGPVTYGYTYRSPYPAPEMYGYGIVSRRATYGKDGRPSKNYVQSHNEIIGRWFHELGGSRRHLSGLQRDVYPFNVISVSHLGQMIEGQFLRQWIEQNPIQRGTLTVVNERIWLWNVPDEIRQHVRLRLIAANLLVCRNAEDDEGDTWTSSD